jgi:hypothetical protein
VTGNQLDNGINKKACENFTDEQGVLFPLRIAVVDSSDEITGVSKMGFDLAYVLEPIPNPTSQESRIGIYLPGKTEKAVLQILELATGKVLQTVELERRGKLEAILDVSKAPSGVYGYRLLTDGKAEPMKKIVVLH